MEFEAYDEGTIAKIVVPEGTDGVKVGAVIAMLAEDGEDAASVAAPGGGDTAEADDEGAKAQPKDEQPAEEAPAAPESPTPHKVETGARKMYDAASHDAEVRSEEHTSELQSLMRISYAVFCLKKTRTTDTHHPTPRRPHSIINNH